MSYKQIDEQVEKWYKTQLGTAGDNQKLKNLAHLIYDQAKAEQREQDARIAEEMRAEYDNETHRFITPWGGWYSSDDEPRTINTTCDSIATAIRQEGKE